MKYNVYSIRDSRTGFLSLVLEQNDLSAQRNFEHACMQADSLMYSHASDYSLCRVGTFDTDTGCVESQLPEVIVDGSAVRK
nr:DNA binding protein [Microvirus sp.]